MAYCHQSGNLINPFHQPAAEESSGSVEMLRPYLINDLYPGIGYSFSCLSFHFLSAPYEYNAGD